MNENRHAPGGSVSTDMHQLIAEYGRDKWSTTFLEAAGPGLLACPVPWHCPDCKGSGDVFLKDGDRTVGILPCDHPNAPTVASMLNIAEAVYDDTFIVDPPAKYAYSAQNEAVWDAAVDATLAQLRAVGGVS